MNLKQMTISLWFEGQNPTRDKPKEIAGVMQNTLEETIQFASEMIRSHWLGECDCTKVGSEHSMSTGLVICSVCLREVHQDGPNQSWTHCEDRTARCENANSVYPLMGHIKGEWCGKDGTP